MASRWALSHTSRGARAPFAALRTPLPTRSPIVATARGWTAARLYSSEGGSQVEPPDYLSEGERRVFDIIRDTLKPEALDVQDISGGCGSMYALNIVSDQFKGMPIIKQHRLVNKVLGDEIKKWHGVQLKTSAP